MNPARNAPPLSPPSLRSVRLGRTRDVLHELLRSARRALPILVGVAGPVAIAAVALLALAGLPLLRVPTLPWRQGAPLWMLQTLLAAWPLWALRRRLLPEAWCVQLRCLPLREAALRASDVAVSAAVLAPLAAVYAVSVALFGWQRPAWFVQGWPAGLLAMGASWGVSVLCGAGVLAVRRAHAGSPAPRRQARAERRAPARGAGRVRPAGALLWQPLWRGALATGPATVMPGLGAAVLLGAIWIFGAIPVLPGAAGAFLFSAWLLGLTERLQRAMEAHLAPLAPWLQALPLGTAWRWQWRLLVALPMLLGLAALLAMVAAQPRAVRALPLAGFALSTVFAHAVLLAVPSAQRETHVGLWAVAAGLLTAVGSELWD